MHLEYLFMHKFAKKLHIIAYFAYAITFFFISAHFVQRKHMSTHHLCHTFP